MSQNDNGQKQYSSFHSGLNTTQYLRIRKEIIILRSDIERYELCNAWTDIQRCSITFSYLNVLIHELLKSIRLRQSVNGIINKINKFAIKYSIVKSISSIIFMKTMKSLLRYRIGTLLKFGMFGFSSWALFQALNRQKVCWSHRLDESGSSSKLQQIENTTK